MRVQIHYFANIVLLEGMSFFARLCDDTLDLIGIALPPFPTD